MTSRDDSSPADDLAPVTPLFGRRGAGRPATGSAPVEVVSKPRRGPTTDDAPEAQRGPGGGDEDAARGGATAQGDWVRADGVDDASITEADAPRPDAVSSTAAALAAISEHWTGPRAVDETIASAVPIDDDDEDQVEPEGIDAQRSRAENVSLHALSRRGVSSSEMTDLLRARDLDEQVVLDEVERLEGVGLLNDRELADNLVRSKHERKGLGRGAIMSELRGRGIAPELIEQAMAEIDDDDEQARADEWAIKRSESLQGLDRATAERRLNGYLMRRGYRSETIRRAVEKALPRGGGPRGGVRFR
jgi:SOS response regulatory protein OraA/RecX